MFASNPKAIFLLDSAGAFSSALFLFIIAMLPQVFGLPQTTALVLVAIAVAYSIYSLCCYYIVKGNWKPYLLVVIVANVLYSVITIAMVLSTYQQLTGLGITYFILELIVLYTLVAVEVKCWLKQ